MNSAQLTKEVRYILLRSFQKYTQKVSFYENTVSLKALLTGMFSYIFG